MRSATNLTVAGPLLLHFGSKLHTESFRKHLATAERESTVAIVKL